jgi:hypothetical protein
MKESMTTNLSDVVTAIINEGDSVEVAKSYIQNRAKQIFESVRLVTVKIDLSKTPLADLTEKALEDMYDDVQDNIEKQVSAKFKNVDVTDAVHKFAKNQITVSFPKKPDFNPSDVKELHDLIKDILETDGMDWVGSEAQRIINKSFQEARDISSVKFSKAAWSAFLVGGGQPLPSETYNDFENAGYKVDGTTYAASARFWQDIGIDEDDYSVLCAASL